MKDYTSDEIYLTYLLRIYSILFLVVGYVFLLFPWFTLELIDKLSESSVSSWLLGENPLFELLEWKLPHVKVNAHGTPAEYFWVFLSFSMMMTIAA